MLPCRFLFVFALTCCFVLACGPVLRAQSGLPQDWQSLSPEEFVAQVHALREAGELTAEDRNAVANHAASLLDATDFGSVATQDYLYLDSLHELGHKRLEVARWRQIANQLISKQDDWAGKPYDEIRGKVMIIMRSKQPLSAFLEARKWVDAGGTLEQANQSPRAIEDLKHPLAPMVVEALFNGGGEPIRSRMSITWEGRVVVPNTGNYRFAVSPVNINADYVGYAMRQDTRVWVQDEEVVTATHEQWSPTSNPIALTQDQVVSLRMTVEIDPTKARYPHGVPNAILFWEGPGIERSIIPSTALKLPDSDEAGVRGTYEWKSMIDRESHSLTQVDSQIDYIWPLVTFVRLSSRIGETPAITLLAKTTWNASISPSKLDELEQTGQIHPLVGSATDVAGSLSTAQRKELLNALLDRPTLFTAADPVTFWRFFRAFHVGAPEKTLEAFGKWATVHADDVPDMPNSISFYNLEQPLRTACCEISTCFFHEQPSLGDVLQSQYLELPSGSCSLPVGYVLNYGHHTTDTLEAWTAFLDTKLADQSLTGDARANWLLVRAHAEEIRGGPRRPYFRFSEQIMLGRSWIDESLSVAQSADVKSRVALELAARLARVGGLQEALDVLDAAPAPTSPEVSERLTAARNNIQARIPDGDGM